MVGSGKLNVVGELSMEDVGESSFYSVDANVVAPDANLWETQLHCDKN